MNKNEKNQIINHLFRSVKNIISISSFHGIPNAYNAERTSMRLMWILFTCLSTAICVWFCYIIVYNFSSYDKVTNIDVIYEQPML